MSEDDAGPKVILTFGSFSVQDNPELPRCSSQEEAAAGGDRSSLANPVKVEGEGKQGDQKGQAGDKAEKGDAASAEAASTKAGKCHEKKRKHCQIETRDPEVPAKALKPGTDSPQGERGLEGAGPGLTGIYRSLSLHGGLGGLCRLWACGPALAPSCATSGCREAFERAHMVVSTLLGFTNNKEKPRHKVRARIDY